MNDHPSGAAARYRDDRRAGGEAGGREPRGCQASAKPDRAHILAAVRAEWPHYDAGNKGKLTPLEFSTWVLRANGATVAEGSTKGQKGIRPVSAMNATSTAFGKADANHDGGVTMDEMVAFLAR